jgi:dynein heavy chain
MALFLDDFNLSTVDIYGTEQPVALLKLVIERSGMYDRGSDVI